MDHNLLRYIAYYGSLEQAALYMLSQNRHMQILMPFRVTSLSPIYLLFNNNHA